ncbi:La protein homolog [Geodia barretti]|uniref:La protein homolog n=3 Tax=Geodia barretti TaxID=519541 RepID=A0AA35TH93_GEOBA|nr:La protein homolog [Geodia barretti]
MSNAVTAEPDSTSSATDAAAIKQGETGAAKPEQREENAADSGKKEERDEKPTKIEGGQEAEAEAKDPPQDNATAADPEQPPTLADCSDGASAEAKPAAPAEKASPLQEKIIRQVEFYFGDRNFPKDKFLQQTVESSTDGWVPLTTLLTFNRLKALSSDAVFIASALSKATNGIIEVSEDGKSVRRHPDKEVPDIFDPEFRKEMNDRTVYAKGFPEDTQLDQIQEFTDKYGKVHLIHMRRLKDRKFKGSVFVEFVSVEDAKKFLTSEKIKFNGNDLIVEWK